MKRALQLSLKLIVPETDSVVSKVKGILFCCFLPNQLTTLPCTDKPPSSEIEENIEEAATTNQSCLNDRSDSSLSAMAKEIDEAEIRIKKAKKLLENQMESQRQHLNAPKIRSMEQILDKQDTCIWNQVVEIKQLKRQCKECKQLRRELQQSNTELERRVETAEQRVTELQTQWVVDREEIAMTERKLGQGAWGVVVVANFRGTEVAAKMVHRSLFIREINMAARIRHPNLTQFIGASIKGDMIILTELLDTSLRRYFEEALDSCLTVRKLMLVGIFVKR